MSRDARSSVVVSQGAGRPADWLERWLPPIDQPGDTSISIWRLMAFAAALIIAALLGVFIANQPLQLSDMLQNVLAAQRYPWSDTLAPLLHPEDARWRPLTATILKFFFDLSQGHYFLTFKAVNIAMVVALLLLVVRLMRVDRGTDLAAAVVGLYVVVGLNTFHGLIVEGYPLFNHLIPVLAVVVSANLARSRGGILKDLGAILCFIVAILNVETGLLVPVVLGTAYVLGWRGVSRRALGGVLLLTLVYVVLRASDGGGGTLLINNPSGYGLRRLEPSELQSIFAGRMALYYAHNFAVSLLSVFFAEPQDGVWNWVGSFLGGPAVSENLVLEVASSMVLTLVIGWYSVRRWRAWRRFELNHSDRLVLLAFAVLIANGVLGFAYAKDVILATAGVFWALAAYAGLREVIGEASLPSSPWWRAALTTVGVLLLSSAFVLRTVSAHYRMWDEARRSQYAWVTAYADRGSYLPTSAEERVLVEQLRRLALMMPVPPGRLIPEWISRFENN